MTAVRVFCLTQAERPLCQSIIDSGAAQGLWQKGRDSGTLADALRTSFQRGEGIVALAATGIVIRCLAPYLTDKRQEPPVVCVAVDGSIVVPLLGGHQGGNGLAQSIAKAIGAKAAITTAGDLLWGIALDCPPPGWAWVNPPEQVQAFMMQLNQSRRVRLVDEIGCDWLKTSALPLDADAALSIHVSLTQSHDPSAAALWLVPKCLSVGMGCERFCDAEHLDMLLDQTLRDYRLPPEAIAGVHSIELKANELGLHAMAALPKGLAPSFFTAKQLNAQRAQLRNPSEVVYREVGVWGVAEGAALAGAGPGGKLKVEKQKTTRATIAVAVSKGCQPIMTSQAKPQGSMTLLGLGPGDPGWRAAVADGIIASASDLVGYGYYIDQVEPLGQGQTRHDFALGEEEKRCAFAMDLAAQGKNVVLLCSGDPGVYAMGAPLFELIERHSKHHGDGESSGDCDKPHWRTVKVQVQPGITAMLAAAAKLGAPLGHDFCAISLSDLLTPKDAILQRLKGAAVGDFVVSLYNPVSKRRRALLDVARDMLLSHRPAGTPVVICRQVGRVEESFHHTTLAELSTDDVDMWCMVLIGSSQTRYAPADANGHRWLYTPRGYANKTPKS